MTDCIFENINLINTRDEQGGEIWLQHVF